MQLAANAMTFICDLHLHGAMENQEVQRAEWDLESDLTWEAKLARQEMFGDPDCPWPWYADSPYEVQEPEVIG